MRSEEHTSELQSPQNLVCRLLLEKKNETIRSKSSCVIAGSQRTSRSGCSDRWSVVCGPPSAHASSRNSTGTRRVFFLNDTATTEIYTLSLHDALPISDRENARQAPGPLEDARPPSGRAESRPLRSEEHTSELQSPIHLVCRLLLEKKITYQFVLTGHTLSRGAYRV